MKINPTELPDAWVIEPDVYGDDRGYFMEIYNSGKYLDAGIRYSFVQDNISMSKKHCLRGLHYQFPEGQGKLVWVVEGAVFDVIVDIRRGSPAFGRWVGTEVSSKNKKQLWIPPGFAHGFCVISEYAVFMYKCTDFYVPSSEYTILWNDPEIMIDWPLKSPVLSSKDQNGKPLNKIAPQYLPQYVPQS